MAMFRRLIAATLISLTPAVLISPGWAQDYPDHEITWIVPSSPGSGFDVVARIITPKLSEVLGQPVVVQNIPGAGGTVGAAEAAVARPDGHTILQININHTSGEALYKDLSYDLLESFDPIIRFTEAYYVFVVNPEVDAQTLEALITEAKANPGTLNLATAGVGSSTYMVGESFKAAADVDMTTIPYEGGGPAMASVVSGETDVYGAPYVTAKPFIEEGKVRALAVASAKPVPFLPDLPTVAETVPGYEFNSWYGLVAPAGTPLEIREKIRSAMVETLADPAVKKGLNDIGLEIFDEGPEEFDAYLKKEIDSMQKLVEKAGIAPK